MKALSLIIKILALIALIGIGLLIYSTCSGTSLVHRIDKTIPDVTVAPFEISTQTNIYMARRATLNEDKSVTMLGWYEKVNNKWVLHEEAITLPKILRPRIGKR